MAGFSIGKAEMAKTSEAANSKNDAGIRSGMEHFSRWDLGKGLGAGFNFDKLRDPYYTDKSERLAHCPVAESFISGTRGDGPAVPRQDTETGRKASALLEGFGLKGIEYKNGFPVFGPVAHDAVEIHMTKDLQVNYRNAYLKFAEKWSSEKRDGKNDWKPSDVKAYIKELGLSIHECEDRKTCQLVPTAIHRSFRHVGGREECKQREAALNGGK